jgi:hypothetical protein
MGPVPSLFAISDARGNLLGPLDAVQNLGGWNQDPVLAWLLGLLKEHQILGVQVLLASLGEKLCNLGLSMRIEIQGGNSRFVDRRLGGGGEVFWSACQYNYVRGAFFHGRPVGNRLKAKGVETRYGRFFDRTGRIGAALANQIDRRTRSALCIVFDQPRNRVSTTCKKMICASDSKQKTPSFRNHKTHRHRHGSLEAGKNALSFPVGSNHCVVLVEKVIVPEAPGKEFPSMGIDARGNHPELLVFVVLLEGIDVYGP